MGASWALFELSKVIVSKRMSGRDASTPGADEALPPSLIGVAGWALALFPWLGLIAPLLMVPGKALARTSVLMLSAAGLLVVAGLVTGGVDPVFVPMLAVGALATGVGTTIPVLVGARRAKAFRRGAMFALVTMALASALDLLVAPGIVRTLVPGMSGGAPLAGRAMGWLEHPNVWAAAVLPIAILLAAWSARADRLGEFLLLVALAAGVVLTSGSRSALLGLAVGLGVVLVSWRLRANPDRAKVLTRAGAALFLLAVVVVAVNGGWRQRTLALLGAGSPIAASGNLFVSSEDLRDPVWWKPVVDIETEPAARGEDRVHVLSRTEGRWTDRVQQRVRLAPAGQYSLSVEFQPRGARMDDLAPAVIGWGQNAGVTSEIVVVVGSGGVVSRSTRGVLNLDNVSTMQVDGWTRLTMSFTNESEESVWLELGVAPRTSEGEAVGGLAVRRLQLEEGFAGTAYVGTLPPDRRRLQAASAVESRLRTYQVVLDRAWQRPIFGWGANAYAELRANYEDTGLSMPDHEHSLPLALFLRFGLFGVAALSLALIAMGGRNPDAWAIVIAVMAANLFDMTVLSSYLYVSTPLMAGMARGLTAFSREKP